MYFRILDWRYKNYGGLILLIYFQIYFLKEEENLFFIITSSFIFKPLQLNSDSRIY